ncbi:MAG: caspase family protein [Acidobacteriota bacterium]
MKELVAILEKEIKALQADFARPGVSELERTHIAATIQYKWEQIVQMKESVERLSLHCPIDGLPSTPLMGTRNRYRCPRGHQFAADPHDSSDFESLGVRLKGGAASADPLANLAPIAPADQKGEMWAFLVGVNQYEDWYNFPKLDYCADDAEALAKTLLTCGFVEERIKLLTDKADGPPTRAKIEMGFAAFASSNKIKSGDLLLFYYSGHGAADDENTYLVSHSGYSNNLAKYAVKLSDILDLMRQSKATKKVIILDACKSGADVTTKGAPLMSERFIANVYDNSAGIVIFASCRKGERSYLDAAKKRSVFTHYLLEALQRREDLNEGKFLTLNDVYTQVLDNVVEWAKGNHTNQTPTRWNETVGEFILADYR